MVSLFEFVMDEYPQVADHFGLAYPIVCIGVQKADICDDTANAVLGHVRGKRNEFGLVGVRLESVTSQPLSDFGEPCPYKFGRVDVRDTASKDSTIIDIHVQASSFPCGVDIFKEGGCEKGREDGGEGGALRGPVV